MRPDCKSDRADAIVFLVLHYKCLYSVRLDCKSDRAESFLFCITNAYIRCGRIANPTERQIRPSGSFQDYYKQK